MDVCNCLHAASTHARHDTEFQAAVFGLPCAIWLEIVPTNHAAGTRITAHPQKHEDAPQLTLRADIETWQRICTPVPSPGWHSFAATRLHETQFSVYGDALHIAQAQHALERLFEILRGQITVQDLTPWDRSVITGRYINMRVKDADITLYVEHSGLPIGAGEPLVMLHTAGADARQWHAIMTDAELRRQWCMLAFDMPAHGRSPPPTSWTQPPLTRDAYLQLCLAFLHQVVQRPAVLLGCSMGAAMALVVAAQSPADVAGVVALEAPYQAMGRRTPFLRHAQVNQAAHNPAWVRGLLGPETSLRARRDATWIYAQGGFGIYADDLHFYSEDFHAEKHLIGLNAKAFGVSLLTGAYDHSATPEDSRRVADLIPGARYCTMARLGHFPMLENPDLLLQYLRPELAHIRAVRAL